MILPGMTSGSGSIALRAAASLDPDRYAVTFISGGGGYGAEPTDGVLKGIEAIKDTPAQDLLAAAYAAGMDVVRIPALASESSPLRDLAALRRLSRQFEAGSFDAVYTYGAKAGLLGRLGAVRSRVPRIVHTITGFPPQRVWGRGLSLTIERRLGRHTDTVIAVGSGVAAEAVRRRLASGDRIRTILPAATSATPPRGTAARGHARRRLGLPPGVRLVGVAGRIDDKRAPEDWVNALAMAANAPGGRDVWGVWLGDGPLREQLLARARRLGIADRLRVISHDVDRSELLPAFDVFAHASRWVALPRPLVDAVAGGVAVVATSGSAVPGLLVPGETALLVPPGRPDLLGRAVRRLLDDPSEAQRFAANAYALWTGQYEIRARSDDLARTYS